MLAHPTKPWLIKTHLESAIGYGYRTKMSSRNHAFPFAESQRHIIDPTNLGSALDNRVEHRLQIGRRAANDAEHFGRRGLMLQSFAQFSVALLDLLEQPHVLDGDRRLVSKSLKECDLFIRERPHLLS